MEKTKQKQLQNYRIKVFFLKYNSDDFSEFLIKYKYFSNYLLIIFFKLFIDNFVNTGGNNLIICYPCVFNIVKLNCMVCVPA